MLAVFKRFFENWRQKQSCDNTAKVDNLLAVLAQDRRFLSHDDIALQLIDRYQKLLGPGWSTAPVESSENLRGRLGLDLRWSNYRDAD